MTLNIEVGGKLEAALKARANKQGMAVDKVARHVLAQALTPDDREENVSGTAWTTGEEKAHAFLAWAQNHRSTPPLSEEAIRQSSLNPARW